MECADRGLITTECSRARWVEQICAIMVRPILPSRADCLSNRCGLLSERLGICTPRLGRAWVAAGSGCQSAGHGPAAPRRCEHFVGQRDGGDVGVAPGEQTGQPGGCLLGLALHTAEDSAGAMD